MRLEKSKRLQILVLFDCILRDPKDFCNKISNMFLNAQKKHFMQLIQVISCLIGTLVKS